MTAAEYIAIMQVASGSSQTLTLSSKGAATGGTFSISAVSSAHINELVVPSGVTALDYSTKGQTQVISGDIFNFGTIYGVVGSGMGNTISINAQEIVNETGGLISTKAPSSLLSSIGGVLSPVNLSLSATNDISNSGSIISSGALTLSSSNGAISNVASSATAAAPIIQAAHDVTLSSGSGTFNNHGLIASSGGNINFTTPNSKTNINISAAGGSFQAENGNINVRTATFTGNGGITLTGGDYLSKNLNLYSGTGDIEGNVNQITGTLNTTAGTAHVTASTASLLLGDNVVGDPTFVNSSGDITITGDNQFSEDVAIIASGNIFATTDGQIVDNGHNVTLVAGAYITSSNSGDNGGTVSGNNGKGVNGNTTAPVTIDTSQSSTSGGNVDLTGSNVKTVIDTSSTTGNAGNVTLVAFGSQPFGGGLSSQGQVLLNNTSVINASAGGSGHGGNVTMIAGENNQDSDLAIRTGAIYTGGGPAGGQGGNIGLYTAAPTTSDAPANTLITFGTNGQITTGNSFVASSTINQNSNVGVFGDLVTAPVGQSGVAAGTAGASAGNITITAGGNVSTLNLLAFGGGGAGGDSVNTNGGAGGSGGNISISSSNQFATVVVLGQVNSSGGGGGGAGSNGTSFGTGGAGGDAGSITILQTGTGTAGQMLVQTTGGVFAAQGGSGGNASATSVGGGGGSYGGGGGGGSSGTGGSVGNTGTLGTLGGGAGGAGYFGGGGADLDGAGGGGGYTAGSAGGSAVNATAGTLSLGGNGVGMSGSTPIGGQLGGAQQGGQGAGALIVSDGGNVPTTSGGGAVTLSSTGFSSYGGPILGSAVNISLEGPISFQGNVVGTSSVIINDGQGAITEAPGALILTPSLTLNMGSIFNPAVTIGIGSAPLLTNAQNITITGNPFGTWINDSASSTRLDASGAGFTSIITVNMTASKATLDVAGLPTTVGSLTLNTGASSTTGGTINFEPSSVQLASGGSVVLIANNLSWSNAATSSLAINADSTSGSGGSINITTNLVNGTNAIGIGSGSGQLNLSARASHGAAGITGGTISLSAPTANLTLDGTAINVGFSEASTAGYGGSIILNVGSITGAGGGTAVLNASAAGANNGGTGNGGTITITTNTSNSTAIGTVPGAVQLIATNGGTTGTGTQAGGSVSFTNLGSGALTVDTSGISTSTTTGGVANISGGSITLSANSISPISGTFTLNVDGVGSGNGGKINITETNTINPATVTMGQTGQFYLSAQGGTTGGNGGSITFSTQGALLLTTDANGNVVGSGLSAAVQPQSASGNGGNLTLTALNFANANALVGATTPLTFNVSGQGSGSGGHIRVNQLDPNSTLTIGTAAGSMDFIATNGATGLTSGTVIVTIANNATSTGLGTLIVDPTAIQITSSGAGNPNVNGGFIELLAPTIVAAASVPPTGPLTINASGVGTGRGGSVVFEESNANSNPTIGTGAGQFQLLAAGGAGGGSGGSIIATSGGNLTINPTGLSVAASGNGNGGVLSLSALNFGAATDGSQGNLLITGNISVAPAGTGSGGTLALLSTSSNSFNIGSTTNNLNGVEGTLTITNGNFSLSSGGSGGIVIQSAITTAKNVTITMGSAGSGDLDINAQVGGTLQGTAQIFIGATGSNTTLFNNVVGGATGSLVTSSTGNIVLSAQNTINGQTTTGQLKINTTSLTASTTNGDIDVTDAISLTSTLTIQNLTAGGSFNISSGGSITTAGFTGGLTGNGGAGLGSGTTASAAISGTVNASAAINGQYSAPLLDASSPRYKEVNKFIFQCVSATYQFGNVSNVTVSGSSSGGGNSPQLVRANAAPASSSSNTSIFTFDADGVGGISLQSDTNMVLSGTFGSSATNTGIFTGAGASVTGTGVVAGKTVQFTTLGGDIGAAGTGNALQTNTTNLTIQSSGSGNVYINNIGKSVMTVSAIGQPTDINISTAGGAKYIGLATIGGDINLTSNGATTVSNVTSAGNLTITDTAGVLTDLKFDGGREHYGYFHRRSQCIWSNGTTGHNHHFDDG